MKMQVELLERIMTNHDVLLLLQDRLASAKGQVEHLKKIDVDKPLSQSTMPALDESLARQIETLKTTMVEATTLAQSIHLNR